MRSEELRSDGLLILLTHLSLIVLPALVGFVGCRTLSDQLLGPPWEARGDLPTHPGV